jgi:SAM-dependent methyltransferase
MTERSENEMNAPKYVIPADPLVSQPCWCGCSETTPVTNIDRWGQHLTTAMCRRCGTLRHEPRMTREQANEFYTQDYEKTHQPEEFFRRQRSLNADLYLRPYLEGVKTILDYGCGPGGKLSPLADAGFEVYGFDLNPQFVAFCQSKGLRQWDPEKRYDCIFLSHTLEHWIQPKEDLDALLARNLEPGGLVIIEVPLVDRLVLGGRPGGFHEETHLAHVWYFSTATLSAMLATLSCKLEFSDGVTTCVFRHKDGGVDAALPSPLRERVRLWIIEMNRRTLPARITQRLNRSLRFVDTDFRPRTIRSQQARQSG